ncbi:unnamed protein product [Ostreobium quekettii]|uniref:diacylglycerol O-acyltransferase n=1 Tax=Ostreobium quekettii TaxID=121088 RepID=A0A8S1J2Y6_9CHLO|nr:unnamed protein product [Ostreobium quekettii]|eukprot:evm.model.scf_625.5 EVM.evm.TU.scf_625.5   scf_625:62610-66257(-)
MGRRRRTASFSESTHSEFSTEDVASLQEELRRCQSLNEHLSEQLSACQGMAIRMQGYLFKYRDYIVQLFSSPWAERYFTLCGSTLKQFITDKTPQPRATIDLVGTTVQWEGLKQGRFWTFMVLDSANCCLIRLSSENRAVAESWIDAIKAAAGVQKRVSRASSLPQLGEDMHVSSPTVPGHRLGRYGSLGSLHEMERSPKHRRRNEGSDATSDLTSPSLSGPESGSEETEQDCQQDNAKKPSPPLCGSTPLHKENKASMLASEQLPLHPQPGLVNLGAVVLVATNFRLILENIFKYGLLFNPLRWIQELMLGSFTALILCWPALAACSLASLYIEKWGAAKVLEEVKHRRGLRKKDAFVKKTNSAKGKRQPGSDKMACSQDSSSLAQVHMLVTAVHVVSCIVCLVVPMAIIFHTDQGGLLPKFFLTSATLAVMMKLVSFAHCNQDLRMARCREEVRPGERGSANPVEGADQPLQYPENLTVSNILYYMCAPTLTYQVTFPRTGRVRVKWLLRRVLELIVAVSFFTAVVDQYINPSIANSMRPRRDLQWLPLLERVLKLSVPVVYAWLCMFYVVFHLWLNILAEALRFGDREFYKDWWNATNLGDYWRQWNLPVHNWLLRTIYAPVRSCGATRLSATFVVFFVSAVAHELMVIVPLKMTRAFPHLFVGIMMQMPLIILTQWMQSKWGERWGNITFWVSFCIVGQPICLLNYYYDFIRLNGAIASTIG